MWTQTVSALHNSLRSPNAGGESSRGSFVDDYLSADLQQTYVGRLSRLPFRQGGAIHSIIAYRIPNTLYDMISQADLRRSAGRGQKRQDGQGPQARLQHQYQYQLHVDGDQGCECGVQRTVIFGQSCR